MFLPSVLIPISNFSIPTFFKIYCVCKLINKVTAFNFGIFPYHLFFSAFESVLQNKLLQVLGKISEVICYCLLPRGYERVTDSSSFVPKAGLEVIISWFQACCLSLTPIAIWWNHWLNDRGNKEACQFGVILGEEMSQTRLVKHGFQENTAFW